MRDHMIGVGALTAHDLAATTVQLGRASAMLTEASLRRLRPATAAVTTATSPDEAPDASLAARFAAPAGAR